MVSRASIAGHPIHPMPVPIPISLFVFSLVADIAVYLGFRCPRIGEGPTRGVRSGSIESHGPRPSGTIRFIVIRAGNR